MLKQNLPVEVKRVMRQSLVQIQIFSKKLWVRIAFGLLIIFMLSQKEFSFHFSIGGPAAMVHPANPLEAPTRSAGSTNAQMLLGSEETPSQKKKLPKATQVALASNNDVAWWEDLRKKEKDIRQELNLANAATAVSGALTPEQQKAAAKFSNLGFVLNPGYAEKHGVDPAVVAAKNKICYDYINRFLKTAQEEAELFNIPVSITLAQGLLESNAGESKLAKKDNNHFGIKCRSKCIGCRCANYTDDSKYDMFRIFDSPWGSYREHSKLLTGKRYKHLLQLPRTDYKNWAHGLKAAGYATDKRYAPKLIAIIEALQLYKYDEV